MAADKPTPKTTQPELIGVPAPDGYEGPWPPVGADGGDPSSWNKSIKKEKE